jgi:ubiquinol-cytochrome c reductase cytochrome c1 subunit
MNLISFRNLTELGFSEAEVKVLASEYDYDYIDDDGEVATRVGLPSDRFKNPYPNKNAAAAANNGKAPPDLSLMVKARHDGANYTYSLLTGYVDAPADVEVGAGLAYNPYYPGGQIAMAAPLAEGQVSYEDGTEPTVQQMSHDVTNFLQWTAEPEMEMRKRMGIKALAYLAFLTIFFYIAKVRIWARIK